MLVFMDGFGHYGGDINAMLDGVYAIIGNDGGASYPVLSTGVKRTGSTSLYMEGAAKWRKTFDHAITQIGVGFAIYPTGLPATIANPLQLMQFGDGAGNMNVITDITPTGAIRVRSQDGTVLWTSNPLVTANAWTHIEMVIDFHATAGTFQVAVNGAPQTKQNGLNTAQSGSAQCWMIQCQRAGFANNPFTSPGAYMDDLFVRDSTGAQNNAGFIGDRQVVLLTPNANGALQDWAASAGAAYTDINVKDDTTFITATATGNKSDFALTDLDPLVTNVAGLMALSRVKKSDAGVARLQTSIESAAAVAAGADRNITTTMTYWQDIVELDPNTGLQWTPAAVNAAKIKVERTA